ncbi:MAG: PilZ domain-containing protein [Candidatus Aminicenantes bacterium]|nr:MAG: PilZ domain-containing protein [Candidatus Aminicenantes bacterium]
MTKTSSSKPKAKKSVQKKVKPPSDVAIDRRREWRFDLPLPAIVEGKGGEGKNFKEKTILENISSTGAYFCLDSGVTVGSKLNLVIEVPSELSPDKKVKLQLGGLTVRLEKADKKGKKQGVALRFSKKFKFITEDKEDVDQ